MSESKISKNTIVNAYVENPNGYVPLAECMYQSLTANQCGEISKALGFGAKGEITATERQNLQTAGVPKDFVDFMAGPDGLAALRKRAEGLVSEFPTSLQMYGRSKLVTNHNTAERGRIAEELADIAVALPFPELDNISSALMTMHYYDIDPFVRLQSFFGLNKFHRIASQKFEDMLGTLTEDQRLVAETTCLPLTEDHLLVAKTTYLPLILDYSDKAKAMLDYSDKAKAVEAIKTMDQKEVARMAKEIRDQHEAQESVSSSVDGNK